MSSLPHVKEKKGTKIYRFIGVIKKNVYKETTRKGDLQYAGDCNKRPGYAVIVL